ncbi:MAG: GNAT family N-acetyltransferase [Thermoplasmata archaeon]|nr:MAG: GNAT family N-acetyltransferase [Thermoplasmata archaeon]
MEDGTMEIVDLTPEHERTFLCCLKPEDEVFAGGVPIKRQWLDRHREEGVGVKLTIDDDGAVAGMVQYSPRELAPFVTADEGTWVVHCIWVHVYPSGIGDRGGRGMGTALLQAAEDEMRDQGARGVAAWGIVADEWMNAPWFERHGYRRVDEQGWLALTFKAFDPDVDEPRFLREVKRPGPIPGKARVSSFLIGWCTSGNLNHEWARRAAEELGEDVVFERFDTSDLSVATEWGISTGIFVNGDQLPVDGTETYEKVRDFIRDRLP